jgi:HEAT repeat protein
MMDHNSDYFTFSIDDMIEELLDEDVPINPKYLNKLSDIGGDELARFEQAWHRLSDWRRQALLENLEQLYDSDTLVSFENICRIALNDPHPQVRFVALRCLDEYDVKDLVYEFIRIVENEEDEELRALAASNLGKYVYHGELEELSLIKLEKIEKCLLGILQGGGTTLIQCQALESLGYSSNQEVATFIHQALDSNDPLWMVSALIAIGRSYDPEWEKDVMSLLTHHSMDIRTEAIRAAGELELHSAKQDLIDYLDDEDSEIRIAAVWALSKIGGMDLQGIFQNMIETSSIEEEVEIIEHALDNLIFNHSLGNPGFSNFEGRINDLINSQDLEI